MLPDASFWTDALRWALGAALLWRVPRLAPGPSGEDGTPPTAPVPVAPVRVSVVVPARDEAGRLPRLLAGLAHQRRAPDEVLVVDDHSGDATAEVARDAGAQVLTSAPLPPGWTGKSWACWQGSRATTGDVLVFLDADTEPEPTFLDALVAEQARSGGLVSVQPYHRMEHTYERASAFFNIVAWMGVGAGSLRRRAPVTGAFGPVLAIDRASYERSGGHEAVRAEVLEDVALARAARAVGVPVSCSSGRGTIAFRMYPDGPGQLVEGWSKNFAAGARATPFTRLLLVVAWLSGVLAVGWQAGAGAVSVATGDGGSVATSVWLWYAAFALQLHWMLRRLGNFGLTAALFPLAAVAFLAIFVRSLTWSVRGQVQWKGRTIPVRGARA